MNRRQPDQRSRAVTVSAALVGLALVLAVLFMTLCSLLDISPAPVANASVTGPQVRAPTDRYGSENSGLALSIASVSPRVVTATGPNMLTVSGSVRNAGDQPVRNVEIRAQLSQRLRTEGDIRTALDGNAPDDVVTPAFSKLTPVLAPGAHVDVELSIPLRGSATESLALQRTGVYELLLNVNGTPLGGDQARLVGLRMLLPVLGLPSAAGAPASTAPAVGGAAPRQVSLLYPLADQPRRLPTGPGEPMLLADDELDKQLAKGGRLDGLLTALETAAPVGSPVRAAICLAVDPDLLRTVADMSTGYLIRRPDGATVPGRGAAAAAGWLTRLRADTASRCVVALPFADADLVALSRADLPDLADYATVEGAKLTAAILGTPVRQDTTWPADGLLDERSLNDYAKAGGHQVVLSAASVSGSAKPGPAGNRGDGTVRLATSDAISTGVLTDPLIALAATGQDGATTFGTALGGRTGLGSLTGGDPISPADQGNALSAQDAIGAIVFRAISGGSRSGPLLVAPPHRWNTTGADASALLDSVNELITEGRLSPATLPGGGPTPPDGGSGSGDDTVSLVYPLRAGAREVPTAVTAQLRMDRDSTAALRSAAIPAQGVGTTPAQVFDPVTQGLLRAASAAWRGHPAMATDAARTISDRVELLRSLVRVVRPPTPYAMGDQEAPLPLTLSNGLPVAMRVRVLLDSPPGLKITMITPDPAQRPIPPLGRLQLRATTQLTRAGSFTVEARLATLDGAPLGAASQLQVRSTAYGTITLWLTGTAGLLLVILAVRRIARRLRGSLGPAAVGPRREPDPTTTQPANQPTGTSTAPQARVPSGSGMATAAPATTGTTAGTTTTGTRRPGSRQRDPMARRLGAVAREEDEAAIRQSPHPINPGPPPVQPRPSEQYPPRRIGSIPVGTQPPRPIQPTPPPAPPRSQPYPPPQTLRHQPTRNGTPITTPRYNRQDRDDPDSTQPVHPPKR